MNLYDLLTENQNLNVTINAGQLIEVIDHCMKVVSSDQKTVRTKELPQYVRGLKGIRELFGVSHVMAQRYKDGIIKDAVSQQGRVIITDVAKALELFDKKKGAKA